MSATEPTDDAARRSARRRLTSLGTVGLVAAVLAAAIVGPEHEALRDAVGGLGPAAPAAFVAGYAVLSLLLVPGALLSAAAGALFGPVWGSVLAFLGGVVGSTAAFAAGRRLGRGSVRALSGPRMATIDTWLTDHGVWTLAVVRILPGVPYSMLNYAAGMTGIPAGHYVKGSLLGLIPGAVAYAILGSTLHDPVSWRFAAALALIAAVLALGRFAERRMAARH